MQSGDKPAIADAECGGRIKQMPLISPIGRRRTRIAVGRPGR
jgi:hypothetical protein